MTQTLGPASVKEFYFWIFQTLDGGWRKVMAVEAAEGMMRWVLTDFTASRRSPACVSCVAPPLLAGCRARIAIPGRGRRPTG